MDVFLGDLRQFGIGNVIKDHWVKSLLSQADPNEPPHGLIQSQEASGDSQSGKSVEGSREIQKTFVYTCIQACTQNDIGHSRIVLSCKEPSKVLESSIGAYKQVRASFGQGTKQVSFQALVKASFSNKELPFFKELPTKPLKLSSRECLSRAS